jgi:phosphate starvation-inducible PhoH-like protein
MKRAEPKAAARKSRKAGKVKDHGPLLALVRDEVRRKPTRAARAPLAALTEAQRRYHSAILASRVVFGVGPAGTGKTYYAAALAAEKLSAGEIEKIIVTRPAIEAGESLGFLPGDLEEKYAPYFRPVREALEERLGSGTVEYMIKAGTIEARPLAYMRGSTLKKAWVIFDEAQNTTPAQMKMFLTRIGEGSTFIINGDVRQKDIACTSGLEDAVRRLDGLPGIATIQFTTADIVRDAMCQAIASRYLPLDERILLRRLASNPSAARYTTS